MRPRLFCGPIVGVHFTALAFEPMTKTSISLLLREALSDFGEAARHWWAHLDERQRADIIELWESAQHTGQPPEAYVCAETVAERESDEPDESTEPGTRWDNDFYQYLVNHELYLERDKAFHICTQHPQAKAAIQSGTIPAGFACPLANHDCPMEHLLSAAGRKSLRLNLRFYRPR